MHGCRIDLCCVLVPVEDPALREMAEYMEVNRFVKRIRIETCEVGLGDGDCHGSSIGAFCEPGRYLATFDLVLSL